MPAPTTALLPASISSPGGVLVVTLYEGTGLAATEPYRELFQSYDRSSNRDRPYALLEYEKSQVSVAAGLQNTESSQRIFYDGQRKLDVSRAAELTIYLYWRDPAADSRDQHVFLGEARLSPFDGTTMSGSQWLAVQRGTGKIRISLDYEHVANDGCWQDAKDFDLLQSSGDGALIVKTKDTRREYALKRIKAAHLVSLPEALQIHHPFVTPLVRATPWAHSQDFLRLFAPFITGGHLLQHLQTVRRFDLDRARLYAAEMVCALAYLHQHDGPNIVAWLKPENVLLDARGHISLSGFGLFRSQVRSEDYAARPTPEYPAPELLGGQGNESRAADWWTLGVLLFEMLTGLPPFYDDDPEKIRRNILHHSTMRLPDSLPPSAQDIISRLLDPRPEKRLGAAGASEVQADPFFQSVDWQKLHQRSYEPTFKPPYTASWFHPHGVRRWPEKAVEKPRQFAGFTYTGPTPAAPKREGSPGASTATEDRNSWELVWDATPREFHFYNPVTGAKQPISAVRAGRGTSVMEDKNAPATPPAPHLPSLRQRRHALGAAMLAGYDRVVSQLLRDHGGDSLDPNNAPLFWTPTSTSTTALQWAAAQDNLGLVTLFLDSYAPPGRVAGTRALGQAVDQQNPAAAAALLAAGARCDFEAGDRPRPNPWAHGFSPHDDTEPAEYLPPLVRAVRRGHLELARLLLAHGADANAGYHDLQWPGASRREEEMPPPGVLIPKLDGLFAEEEGEAAKLFTCGRAVQLAMALGRRDMVDVLLDHGAEPEWPQPVWGVPGHETEFVSRRVYQRVTAALRAVVAERIAAKAEGGC